MHGFLPNLHWPLIERQQYPLALFPPSIGNSEIRGSG
jgi:hypothetical protein